MASAPIFTALLAFRLDREELATGLGAWSGSCIGIVGVVLLFGVDLTGDSAALLGGLMVLLASLGYAIGPFEMKRKLQGVQPVGIAAATMTLAALAADAGRPVRAGRPRAAGSDTVGSLLALGAGGTGVAFLIFYTLIAEVGPGRATVVAYIAPGFSVVYGVVLLGEALHRGHRGRAGADPRRLVAGGRRPDQPKRTFPFDRARACARSMKSRRLSAARSSRVTSRSRAFSERRLSRPCLASSPKSTVAAMS